MQDGGQHIPLKISASSCDSTQHQIRKGYHLKLFLFYNATSSGLCVSVTWSNTLLNMWDCRMTLCLPQWRLMELENRV